MAEDDTTAPPSGEQPGSGAPPVAPKPIEKFIKAEKIEFKEAIKEKVEFKEHKDAKFEKSEKNEAKEHKDAKHEKLEKNETKEHKDTKQEKLEKNEAKENKDNKHETKEIAKHEKFEQKEFSKGEIPEKQLIKEKDGKEIREGGIDLPVGPGDPIDQRLAAVERSLAEMQHFISTGQRPDLSQGALTGEADRGRNTKKT